MLVCFTGSPKTSMHHTAIGSASSVQFVQCHIAYRIEGLCHDAVLMDAVENIRKRYVLHTIRQNDNLHRRHDLSSIRADKLND